MVPNFEMAFLILRTSLGLVPLLIFHATSIKPLYYQYNLKQKRRKL